VNSPETTSNQQQQQQVTEDGWTPQELALFNEGIQRYPANKFEEIQRLSNIARIIKTKSIREVAQQMRKMQQQQQQLNQQYFQTTDPNINQQTINQQPQQMNTQQQQTTNQKPSTPIQQQPQTPTQAASKTRKRKSQTYAEPQKKKVKKVRRLLPGKRTLTSQEETQPQQQTQTTAQTIPQRQTPPQTVPENPATINTIADHINMNSKRIPSQQEQENFINNLLSHNCLIIAKIRENLLKGDINNNLELISQFRNNIIQVLTCMSKMPGIMSQMPPIPVKLNTICIPNVQQQTQASLHSPHQS